MVKQVIVVGDTLAPHGGTVMTGSNTDTVDGKAIARQGDRVECKEHGAQAITEGDESSMVSGQPVALHGHRAACGCTLVSRTATLSMS
ncbi:PAAR domain-containing protein [Caballeronia sp. SEWSISQ10-4 2]|uniref:PAAR domain-containing protein n=1 Tax=Caballeronia sp. SEWSISQ10-4 2 TaxID=2937438 RepID=UPI002656C703|nr:PAAR domain-containing protein [Caballeronia sp. SEWSISQ10-4 2]MDN7179281.1 PAAR domain-containing protein [Caballeronia sp. SEWSISQ10-4 2]